jgi:pimeloyl-ACP methyl ester carboxylesterase
MPRLRCYMSGVLALVEKVRGPAHPDTVLSWDSLAELYRKQDKYSEREPLHKRALVIVERALGPDHPSVAPRLNDLAFLYHHQSRRIEAELFYKRVIAIRERAFGSETPDVAASLVNVARFYVDYGRSKEAEPFCRSLIPAQGPFDLRVDHLLLRTMHASIIKDQIPQTEFYIIQGAGHMFWCIDPVGIYQRIVEFLK